MKLKFLVTSMILIGAAGAASAQQDDANMQNQLDAMKAQMAQMQATMNSNNGGAKLPADNWFNRISVSGLINVDGNIANKSPVTFGANNNTQTVSSVAIPNANIFIDANVSDWTKAHVGLIYGQDMNDYNLLRAGAFTSSQRDSDNGLNVDEAYVTIGNFAKTPFYFKAGQQYLPFGSYNPYESLTPSLTQVLSQVNDVAGTVGFVAPKGFNGSVFALSGINKASGTTPGTTDNSNTVRNFGANLGFANTVRDVQYNLGVQYLRNMADVTGVRYSLGYTNNDEYTAPVSALAANAGVKYKALDASAKYVGAMNSFNQNDVAYTNDGGVTESGARPAAWGVDTGYSFPILNHDSRFGLGYQGSYQSANLDLTSYNDGEDYGHMAQKRYLANYTFNVSKYTDIGLEVRHDIAYGTSQGGAGSSANTATARVSVKFA